LTFAFKQQDGNEMPQYLHAKRAVQQSFIDCGATLSHHHAVGTEHLPWLTDDISPLGITAIAAIKAGLDPDNVMNPGRLRPSAAPFEEWLRVVSGAATAQRP
jgi:alkyldihydroxyacetonephosphate synthase